MKYPLILSDPQAESKEFFPTKYHQKARLIIGKENIIIKIATPNTDFKVGQKLSEAERAILVAKTKEYYQIKKSRSVKIQSCIIGFIHPFRLWPYYRRQRYSDIKSIELHFLCFQFAISFSGLVTANDDLPF